MGRWLCALALASPAAALRTLMPDFNTSALSAAVDRLHPSDADRETVMRQFPDLVSQMSRGPMCYDFDYFRPELRLPRCSIFVERDCPMSSMKGNTLVFPRGKTRCMDRRLPNYAFQVLPGSSKKLLVLFDGGGASWDAMSAALNTANKTRVIPVAEVGLMRNDSRNPLADYTKVFVQYCSGDLHAGNKTQDYNDSRGDFVVQMGYHNTLAALEWAKANMESKLDNLVISGMSTGAIGAEVWSKKILGMFNYKSGRVLTDSYVPVFPGHFQGNVLEGLGVCTTDLAQGMEELCRKKQLAVETLFTAAMRKFPHVGFASLTSTKDWGQTLYYQLTAMTQFQGSEALRFDGMAFHNRACYMLMRYNKYKNFAAFLRTDILHVYSLCDAIFDYSEVVAGRRVKVIDWMRRFLEQPHFRSVANPVLGPVRSGCHRKLGHKVAYANSAK